MTEDDKSDRNRRLALYHARLIQERKDIEAQNILAVEHLIDLPSSRTDDCQRVSDEDADCVRQGMGLFSTADFDAVIEERNINDRCGYVVCPRPKPTHKSKSKLRIFRNSGSKSPQIVDADDLEKWCSEECIKRALYLRVQLSDTPAWERAGMATTDLQLYGEPQTEKSKSKEEAQKLTASLGQLAFEREDPAHDSPRPSTLDVEVHEKGQ